ncbi:MAG: deoxyribodipyrimidine photo-lyase [Actinobacteria bacterium]|nr:deoxyribodipyrimidine photo-lyase [Actinomycetota bacterium]
MVEDERVKALNRKAPRRGAYVLYWMQASQRAFSNHALAYAATAANERGQPLVVFFGLTTSYPSANQRHYRFMLEGLAETQAGLADMGIRLVARVKSPQKGALELSRDASLVVVDRGYLRHQRQWREAAASRMDCPLVQVESDVVVPLEVASPKEEYAASTFRPKIARQLERYLAPLPEIQPVKSSLGMDIEGIDLSYPEEVLDSLDIDRGVPQAEGARGGLSHAEARLQAFLQDGLELYAHKRNDPGLDLGSGLSPYLHFGQISPLHVALEARAAGGPGVESFLEELIVRRELSVNFVYYNPAYDSLDGLPAWALTTLREHAGDRREFHYSLRELEGARTHDPYWNAAQKEMVATGRMHNYMRMYWGKKFIAWSRSPHEAYKAAIHLNDRYELDGRDPNGYTGVLWCFGKHDRAWKEREVLGKLRYLSREGLRRKFDMESYVNRSESLYEDYRRA